MYEKIKQLFKFVQTRVINYAEWEPVFAGCLQIHVAFLLQNEMVFQSSCHHATFKLSLASFYARVSLDRR